MNISDEGLRLIKSFEGFHTAQPDGSCVAYLCPAKVPTIGYGCTEGVTLGMRWTAEEVEAGLRREIAKHEAHVSRLVTVEISQNEFDAMVSLCYNIGAGALGNSTVLKRLNKGDRAGAAQAFAMWNKAGGKVLPGLVARRAREAALFMKPTVAPSAPFMPQKVEPTPEPLSRKIIATGTSIAAGAGTYVSQNGIPAPTKQLTESATNVATWRALLPKGDPITAAIVGALILFLAGSYAYNRWREE